MMDFSQDDVLEKQFRSDGTLDTVGGRKEGRRKGGEGEGRMVKEGW
jgi:hypothetical protein